jgi:hypothetical protein
MKRVLLVGMALAILAVAVAAARTTRHSTTIKVDQVTVTPNGTLIVSGLVRSDSRDCSLLRGVGLFRSRPGRDQVLDVGFASIVGREWALRSPPGAADGSKFYVEAPRLSQATVSVGRHHRRHRRKIVCKPARAPVNYLP